MTEPDLITEQFTIEEQAHIAAAREILDGSARDKPVTLHVGQVDAAALCNTTEGMMQMGELLETTSRLAILHSLQRIKDAKAYKGAHVKSRKTGEYVTLKTWEEYCEAFGKSRYQIDADLKNLAVFGDNLIKIQDSLGIGYRELRKIRAGFTELPKEEQDAALIEISALEDKEEAMALVDELQAKLTKTEHKIKELQADVDSRNRSLENSHAHRERAELELQKLLKIKENEPEKLKTERDMQSRKDITAQIHTSMGELLKLCNLCSSVLYEADYDLREYVNNQVHGLCETFAGKLADIHMDVNFTAILAAHSGNGAATEPQ